MSLPGKPLSVDTTNKYGTGRNPGDISGLNIWLEAGVGITLQTPPDPQILSWQSQKGGAVFDNITTTQQPLEATDPEGFKVVRFDGIDDILNESDYNAVNGADGATLFVVCRLNNVNTNQRLFSLTTPSGASARLSLYTNPSGGLTCGNRRLDADAIANIASPNNILNPNQKAILGCKVDWNTGTITFYKNGSRFSKFININRGTGAYENTNSFAVSVGNAFAQPTNGDIYEVVLYRRPLNEEQIRFINTYYISKYAIR